MYISPERVRKRLEKAVFSGYGVELCDTTHEELKNYSAFTGIPECLVVEALLRAFFEAKNDIQEDGARHLGMSDLGRDREAV